MKELTVSAAIEKLGDVYAFVERELAENECPTKAAIQISIAVEEIYGNIIRYARYPEIGDAAVRCAVGGTPLQVTIQFLDGGKPFAPVARKNTDITLLAEKRAIGGLDILMAKKPMNDVSYEYRGGCHILTLKKSF